MLHEIDTQNSKRVIGILKHPERLLATVLISNNLVNVGIVIISTFITAEIFNFSEQPVLAFFIQVITITFLILLFGEIIPKIYASHHSVKFALKMAYSIILAEKFFYPLSSILLKSQKEVGCTIYNQYYREVLRKVKKVKS
jgi:Mg2+/Co2+ transporter CorB